MHDAHEIVAAYWAAAEARDWARRAAGARPPSGSTPRGFQGTGISRSNGSSGKAATRRAGSQFSEPGDQYPGLCFFDFDDHGRIARITDFWPTAAELPASRAHLVERY